jgi:rhamnose utilization protein RhaD (predicted bifunctional aldolase and dehydrogenase)
MSNQAASKSKFKFVKYLWNDEEVEGLDGVDRLVYRSNRLGDDLTLTNRL